MKGPKQIEEAVEKAMSSVDGMQRAEPPFNFYNQILYKLEKPKAALVDKWNSLLLNPAVAFATLCLILMINAFVVVRNMNSNTNADQNTVALTDEYNQSSTPSFYLENPKP